MLVKAVADKRLLLSDDVEVWALSPSDAAITQALVDFSKEFEQQLKGHRVVASSPNLNAVVLWLQTPHCHILLGSDLENSKNALTGWQAVIDSEARPDGQASVVKIPHHGSDSGHHAKMWSDMVSQRSVGMMTAYTRSNLPQPADIDRLKSLTELLYQTTVKAEKPPRRANVDDFIKCIAKNRKVIRPKLGHVQTRLSAGGKCITYLNANAKRLS